jgi:hypothetical protein
MTALDPFADTSHDSWLPVNLADLPDTPPAPPDLGGFGILYRGKRHTFSGPQESAKTVAAYAIGLETLRIQHDPIAIIDFEMGARATKQRLRELGATNDELNRILYVEPDAPANHTRINILAQLQPILVIIDATSGAYSQQGFDDNSRSDAEKFVALYINPFFHAGIATLTLDHVVKNTDARGKYTQGSARKTEAGEVHLGFDVITPIKRGTKGLYKITTWKDREGWHQRGQLAELHLTSHPETHHISWEWKQVGHTPEGETWMPTKVMQHASEILERATEPLTTNNVTLELGGKRDIALKAIGHLVRLGYATETHGPRNSKLLTHTRTFTVLEWESNDNPSLVPTGSPLVPGTGQLTGSQPVPPYGGRNQSDDGQNHPLVPDEQTAWTWVDELTPPDHPEH